MGLFARLLVVSLLVAACAAKAAEPDVPARSSYFGDGCQSWTLPGFAMTGARGQVISVVPGLRLVLVQTAAWQSAGDRAARAELLALWRGVVEHSGSW